MTNEEWRESGHIPGECWCQICTVDAYWHWLDERAERRAQIKRERKLFTIDEKYDLGGEA